MKSLRTSLLYYRSTWMFLAWEFIALILIVGVLLPYLQYRHNEDQTQQVARQTVSAFWYSNSDMDLLCYEWATRPELTQMVSDPENASVPSIFNETVCDELDIDILLLLDTNHEPRVQLTSRNGLKRRFPYEMRNGMLEKLYELLIHSGFRMKHVVLLENQPFYVLSLPVRLPDDPVLHQRSQGYLVFARHLDRSDAGKLSLLLQKPVTLDRWSVDHLPFSSREHVNIQKLISGQNTFEVSGSRLNIYTTVPGLERNTGIAIRVTDTETAPFLSRTIILLTAVGLFLINLLMILLHIRTREQIRMRLQLMVRIVDRISGRLFIRSRANPPSDEIEELHTHLDNLFMNIQRMQKERSLMHERDVIKEKLVSAGRIAAELSHEILTPIRVIRNCLAPLERKLTGAEFDERDRRMFTLLNRELDEMETLVRNLLQFFREERIEGEPVRLSRIIRKSVDRFNQVAGTSGPEFTVQTIPDGQVFVSEHQLEQVLLNLFQNARDAGSGLVEVFTSILNENILVHVIDDGHGIPDHVRAHIFEPFYTRKKKRGVGLGLNISYNIVRNYDGELYLERHENNRTHFVIRLPLMEEIHGTTDNSDRR